MILNDPIWLLLIIPLGIAAWVWPAPSRLLMILRAALLIIVVIAMTGLAIRLPRRAGTVVVVADSSLSMPQDAGDAQLESIRLIHEAMSANDRLAVVTFGRDIVVEQAPQPTAPSKFEHILSRDASSLAEALDRAVALIPPESPGRILLISDGRWTGADPQSIGFRCASRDIAIDYRELARPTANDLAVDHIDAPSSVAPGESFVVAAWVRAPAPQQVAYALWRGSTQIASGERTLNNGLNRLIFRDTAVRTGAQGYRFIINTPAQDPVPENNIARHIVGIRGPKPMLALVDDLASSLPALLNAGGASVEAARPDDVRWSLEELANYAAVIIENVPAHEIGTRGMETLAAWTTQTGAGLMTTGGKNSYGPGGYYRSPLEPIMPVSMELRREHRKLALAMVVVLDRSGSMTMPVPGGKRKIDLANVASAEVLNMLSAMDEFGILAVDSQAHLISPLRKVENKGAVRDKILRIDSQGGGIYVYTGLREAASMLQNAEASTRHIILFSDAADSEEPGEYKQLLQHCTQAGITVSVIGLGLPTDVDADFLRDIALRGNGRIYFTEDANDLPRLFAQDTFVVARNSFIDKPSAVKATPALINLTAKPYPNIPDIGGFNLTYLRDNAQPAVITQDQEGYNAPFVTGWQAGAGRVLCYTGEADGKYTGPIARWNHVGDWFTSLARWTAGESDPLEQNMMITQRLEKGLCVIDLHLDPRRATTLFSSLPTATTLHETDAAPRAERRPLQWVSPDVLRVNVPLDGAATALSTVQITGQQPVALPPVRLPYSPEYLPVSQDLGGVTLKRLARATGGAARLDLTTIWSDLPKLSRMFNLSPYLLSLAVILLLIEIIERRTGALALAGAWITRRRRIRAKAPPAEALDAPAPKRKRRRVPRLRKAAPPDSPPPTDAPDSEPAPDDSPAAVPDMTDALAAARNRARRRTDL